MKFGVREIANVVFKAKSDITIGNTQFKKGQPVLYIDTAKTSTVEVQLLQYMHKVVEVIQD